MSNEEFLEHRKQLIDLIHEFQKDNQHLDFIVVGSSVPIIRGINIERKENDIDILLDGSKEFDIRKLYKNRYFHHIFKNIRGEEIDIIEGLKIARTHKYGR